MDGLNHCPYYEDVIWCHQNGDGVQHWRLHATYSRERLVKLNYLAEQVYCSSRLAMVELLWDLSSTTNNNSAPDFSSHVVPWDLYENLLNEKIGWPCSEERLALVLYLYLNAGFFPEALSNALNGGKRDVIWLALSSSYSISINKKQCFYLVTIFGEFDPVESSR